MPKGQKIKTDNDCNNKQIVCLACSTPGEWESVFNLSFEDTSFIDIFNSCMGFELWEYSKHKHLCLECIKTIIAFYTFKQAAHKSYEELCKKRTEAETCVIKPESFKSPEPPKSSNPSKSTDPPNSREPSKSPEHISENSEHIVFLSIDDPNILSIDDQSTNESTEAESENEEGNTLKLKLDVKKENLNDQSTNESSEAESENEENTLKFKLDIKKENLDDQSTNESSEAESENEGKNTKKLKLDIKKENLEESTKAEREDKKKNTIKSELDIRKDNLKDLKQNNYDAPLDESDKNLEEADVQEALTYKELKERNLWQCMYCKKIISKDNPAGIKKHRYAEKIKRLKIFECPVCHKKFTKSIINEHILRHEGEKPAKCNICGKGVSSAQALKQHMMLHEGKKYSCEICNKGFTQAFLLKEHMDVHEKNKTFLCPICGMSFPSPTTVRQHQYKHRKRARAEKMDPNGVTRPICDVCGKKFSSSKTLEVHRTKHDSEETFECDKCGKKFGHRALLTSHIWHHFSEFRCLKCYKIYKKDDLRTHDCEPLPVGQDFVDFLPNECRECGEILQVGNIDRHLRRHDAKECQTCGKRIFGTRRFLFHINSHRLKCDICGKGFAKKESYILHTTNKVCTRINMNKIKRLSM